MRLIVCHIRRVYAEFILRCTTWVVLGVKSLNTQDIRRFPAQMLTAIDAQ